MEAPTTNEFHFFSGKGGVGKTTLAAATAVCLARSGKRVLVTSTDPAHSLSDVFDREIGHQGVVIEPSLRALEIDSSARWREATGDADPGRRRSRIERALGDAMKMLGDAPGVDEFVSLELLLECMSSDQYDAVVFDTAPTGHTLRLLLLPQMLDGWIGRMLTLRRYFSRIGRAFKKLVPRSRRAEDADLSGNLQQARDRVMLARQLICDPQRTHFSLVTIPEAMSTLETLRTLEQLKQNGIRVGQVLVNQVQPPSESCRHCRLRHAIHQRELSRLNDLLQGVTLRQIASKSEVIRGADALHTLGQEIWPS